MLWLLGNNWAIFNWCHKVKGVVLSTMWYQKNDRKWQCWAFLIPSYNMQWLDHFLLKAHRVSNFLHINWCSGKWFWGMKPRCKIWRNFNFKVFVNKQLCCNYFYLGIKNRLFGTKNDLDHQQSGNLAPKRWPKYTLVRLTPKQFSPHFFWKKCGLL